ncbi:Ig-like domain-containing protein [Luethyella okanaganae]|uniref:Ig-like domain-containing protein n=1 Tax=Luethyella okanaganae TaxID=69372 RepID=A0ABW1VII5_9MICO
MINRLIALLTGSVAAVLLALAPLHSATAAEFDAIVPGSIAIINDGDDPNAPIHRYQNAKISADWDTTGRGTQAGDTFSLGLPAEFAVASGQFELLLADQVNSAGTCVVILATGGATARVVCTFNDYVSTHDNVKGSLWVSIRATEQTTSSEIEIVVSGNPVVVPLPGGAPVGPQDFGPVPSQIVKHGWWTEASRTAVHWVILVPGQAAGNGPIVFRDTFSWGQTFDPDSMILQSLDNTQTEWEAQSWVSVPTNQWQLTSSTAQDFVVTFAGPAQANKIYRLVYDTTIDNPSGLVVGDVFDNSVAVNQTTAQVSVFYEATGGGTAGGDGRGGFVVAKRALVGDGASLVAPATTYTVLATYLGEQGSEKSVQITLTAGGSPVGISALPAGTKVTLSEQTPSAIAGVNWKPAQFKANVNPNVRISPDKSSVELTIIGEATLNLTLTNTAEAAGGAAPPVKPVLAATGVELIPLGASTLLLLLGGGLALAIARRRRADV